jgi:hypothetical protein
MSRNAGERERLRALTDGGHGGVGEGAIGSETERRDAACGAEFVVGNSNRTTSWASVQALVWLSSEKSCK